jgi:hypothetical protein
MKSSKEKNAGKIRNNANEKYNMMMDDKYEAKRVSIST